MSDPTTTETAPAEHHEDHEALYWKIGGILLLLTIATVWVSTVHLPSPFGLIIGLGIAGIKGSLVAAFFMHLKWEKKLIHSILILAACMCVVLFSIPIIDGMMKNEIRYQSQHPAVLDTGKHHGGDHH
ncbi:MAG: hypothetical protein COB53_10980 [Elusimicrobia bacterium]|nr:MAG: hypothetical protein COB53_10980 [Elusimicrobiota bacterium]